MEDLYRKFEDSFRGSEKEITTRLSEYLPMVKVALRNFTDPLVVDLGSGRNEWLGLLKSENIRAIGIDSNALMSRGHSPDQVDVIHGDVVEKLSEFEDNSIAAVTAFHLVEHLDLPKLINLFQELKKKIRPGGFLILETPDPSNLFVSSHNFYLDPTHLRPYPGPLLKFLVEAAGIGPAEIVPLHNVDLNSSGLSLAQVLMGGSQDYALIATTNGQTPGAREALIELISSCLKVHEAKQMQTAAAEFDWNIAQSISSLSARVAELENILKSSDNPSSIGLDSR